MGDIASVPPNLTPVPQVLQDLKTKIVYYLESDRRHVTAIAPDGKILWCSEVIPPIEKLKGYGVKMEYIDHIRFNPTDAHATIPLQGEDYLRVEIGGEGFGGMSGHIEKKTGKFIPGEVS